MSRGEPNPSRPYMPGYGIPDGGGESLRPWDWAREHLMEARYYWMATTRPDGRPHLMPVWGIWVEDTFYFSTGRDSRKARNLREQPACTIGVERGDHAVVVEGSASVVTDAPLLQKLSEAYAAKYGMGLDPDLGDVYAVRPRVAFGLVGTEDFAETATRWSFAD